MYECSRAVICPRRIDLSEIPSRLDSLQPQDQILIPYNFSSEKTPLRALLADFGKLVGKTSFTSPIVNILHQGGIEHLIRPQKNPWIINLSLFEQNNQVEFYAGLPEIITALDSWELFSSHAAAMRIRD